MTLPRRTAPSPHPPRPRSRSGGFSLLEALVAMVLLATLGMATYDVINASINTLHRVQEHNAKIEAVRASLAYIEKVNPLTKPSGNTRLGPYRVQWSTTALEQPKNTSRNDAGAANFQVGLYEVRVRVYKDPVLLYDYTVRAVGYDRLTSKTK